jgi:hypothetical protein
MTPAVKPNPKKRKLPEAISGQFHLQRALRSSKRLHELSVPHILDELTIRREVRHKIKQENKEKQRRQRVKKYQVKQY